MTNEEFINMAEVLFTHIPPFIEHAKKLVAVAEAAINFHYSNHPCECCDYHNEECPCTCFDSMNAREELKIAIEALQGGEDASS